MKCADGVSPGASGVNLIIMGMGSIIIIIIIMCALNM